MYNANMFSSRMLCIKYNASKSLLHDAMYRLPGRWTSPLSMYARLRGGVAAAAEEEEEEEEGASEDFYTLKSLLLRWLESNGGRK